MTNATTFFKKRKESTSNPTMSFLTVCPLFFFSRHRPVRNEWIRSVLAVKESLCIFLRQVKCSLCLNCVGGVDSKIKMLPFEWRVLVIWVLSCSELLGHFRVMVDTTAYCSVLSFFFNTVKCVLCDATVSTIKIKKVLVLFKNISV